MHYIFDFDSTFTQVEALDELAKKVKRAKQLLHWCRLRLQKTGGEIDELLED